VLQHSRAPSRCYAAGLSAGGSPPRCAPDSSFDIPIAIDCCAVSGSTPGAACTQNYCATTAETINPCPLESGEIVSCLEPQSVREQNACWTLLDGLDPSIGSVPLIEFIADAPILAQRSEAYLDNGSKIPAYREMYDRMFGRGHYFDDPAGSDRHPEVPGIDSWVVRLPVVECQNPGNQCTSLNAVTGALCFEIRAIEAPPFFPERQIKGRFLCPERDPIPYQECRLGPFFTALGDPR
jgi:hypothetical protein